MVIDSRIVHSYRYDWVLFKRSIFLWNLLCNRISNVYFILELSTPLIIMFSFKGTFHVLIVPVLYKIYQYIYTWCIAVQCASRRLTFNGYRNSFRRCQGYSSDGCCALHEYSENISFQSDESLSECIEWEWW